MQCSRVLSRYLRSTWRPLQFTSSRTISACQPRCDTHPPATSKFAKQRINDLGGKDALEAFFPRLSSQKANTALSAAQFLLRYSSHEGNEDGSVGSDASDVTVYGRVVSRRKQGSRLMFIDIESGRSCLQVVVNLQGLRDDDEAAYNGFRKSLKRGDWLMITGSQYKTNTGQLSLLAQTLPEVVSISLQPLPESVSDPGFLSNNRHVERILDKGANEALILRHRLINNLRNFFSDRDFVEVNTPILTAGFGGAIARPFETKASEFPNLTLNLRIAPELWLKRLIVGNMEKVFEIGPAFRNEGVDFTHNPEFSICEFYQIMTNLEELMEMTEQMFSNFCEVSRDAHKTLSTIPDPSSLGLRSPFERISFIPALQEAMRERFGNWDFPDLEGPGASEELLQATQMLNLPLPAPEALSIPKLLDHLAGELLERRIVKPTWLMHHPECMSPLAKSFTRDSETTPGMTHRISARAELFIQGREYVNCYEEENSPVEQRRKFQDQLRQRNVEGNTVIDESYIAALEWGMPPTGGWGCGIDRLVMLLSGRNRIADVLPFGTLSNVASLGSRPP